MKIKFALIAVVGLGLACGEEPSSNLIDADLLSDISASQDASIADVLTEVDSTIAIDADAEADVDAAPELPPQPPAQNAIERVSVETWLRGLPPADGDPPL